MTRFEAPGKIVLLGEYAVLDGCPALAIAVDSGVACDVTPAAERTITTPDGDDRFVRAALDAVQAPAAHYAFTATNPLDLPDKPGFGGSAAAVVAALEAGGCPPEQLFAMGYGVHYGVQGSGSGIDVAVAATGGALRFENTRITPVELPMPLVVYSGSSARTGPRVEAYEAWRDRRDFVQRSRELVAAFPDDPIPVVQAAWRLLSQMAMAADLPYRTPAIDAIVALAEQHDGAAKPSGAGGGDVVVAWADDADALRAAYVDAGFAVLDVHPWTRA
jgi:phosphomevalonate kinase